MGFVIINLTLWGNKKNISVSLLLLKYKESLICMLVPWH